MADDLKVLQSTDPAAKTVAAWDDGDGKLKQLFRLVFGAQGSPKAVSETNGLPVAMSSRDNESCGAGTTATLGSTGAVGDFLDYLWVVPTSTTAGSISIQDGTNAAQEVFHGGTIPSILPFPIPWGKISTNGPWKVTMGTGITAIGWGKFT